MKLQSYICKLITLASFKKRTCTDLLLLKESLDCTIGYIFIMAVNHVAFMSKSSSSL